MTKKIIICKNKHMKKGYRLMSHDDYEECNGCMFLDTYRGESWRDDRISCMCGTTVKYKDKIEYTPAIPSSCRVIKQQNEADKNVD